MGTIDYAALGFRLTAVDAAVTLQMTVAEVNDLLRSGDLAFLTMREQGVMPQLTARMHADEVADFARRARHNLLTSDVSLSQRVQAALREYLREVPPAEDYDEALVRDTPLLASTKRGDALHVRSASVAAFHNTRHPEQAVLTDSATMGTLARIGALRVRGVIPAADKGGKQRWGIWWRVPLSLLDGDNTSAAVADVVDGVREPGERMRVVGKQGVFLDSLLGED